MVFKAFTLFLLFLPLAFFAQDSGKKERIGFREKLQTVPPGERLRLLDSLSGALDYDASAGYDSISDAAYRLALELDSVNKATELAADRIYFKNSIISLPDQGKAIYQNAFKVFPKVTDNHAKARLLLNAADSYYFLSETGEALKLYDSAGYFARQLENQRLNGFVNLYRGQLFEKLGNFNDAVTNYQKSLDIFEQVKDTFNIQGSLNSLAVIFAKNDFFDEANLYRKRSKVLAEKTQNYGSLVPLYFNQAYDYSLLNLHKQRIASLKKAAYYAKKSKYNDVFEPALLAAFTTAYAETDSLDLAKKYFDKLMSGPDYYRKEPNEIEFLYAKMSYNFAVNNLAEALEAGKAFESLAIKSGAFYENYRAKKALSKILKKLGRTGQSQDYLLEYYQMRDSISSVKKVQNFTYLQTQYETEKKEQQIALQQKDIDLLNAKNKAQKQRITLGILISAILIVALFLWNSRRRAKQKQRTQQEFSHKLLVAQEEERSRLARELHDSLGQKLVLLKRRLIDQSDNEDDEQLADDSIKELRAITKSLHPASLDLNGFTAAVNALIRETEKNTKIRFETDINFVDDLVDRDRALHLYRMIQESINNMVKYSNTQVAQVIIKRNAKEIQVFIHDQGTGFDLNSDTFTSGLGMKTLRERSKLIGSKLSILSQLGKGSTVAISLPV
ncbi:ATP-binding protein [Leeuwenhoekiella parthenopeia]|uniref:Sensor histidine kinase n=1 Tax=Leeuwenhoekiella parthenopeia TaxID=2890320 RepID=A0ABS8GRM6_9FLAO|nr:sensor histidine kinase [Leeuwenhoekiella parthenopeia]MCC4212622.1 sensor histidine kinase [Leeuwenhoekiella parthenopeia]